MPVVQSRVLEDAMAEVAKQIVHAELAERGYHSNDRPQVVDMSESASYLRKIVMPMLAFD
jgi:hypothetical protein